MKKHFEISPFAFVLLVIFALLLAYFWQLTLKRNDPYNYSETVEVWAIIRTGEDGKWTILNDPAHTSHNVASLYQGETGFIIYFEEEFEYIHWSTISPDESLVLEDIEAGASIAKNQATIYTTRNGESVNPAEIRTPHANFWFYAKGIK